MLISQMSVIPITNIWPYYTKSSFLGLLSSDVIRYCIHPYLMPRRGRPGELKLETKVTHFIDPLPVAEDANHTMCVDQYNQIYRVVKRKVSNMFEVFCYNQKWFSVLISGIEPVALDNDGQWIGFNMRTLLDWASVYKGHEHQNKCRYEVLNGESRKTVAVSLYCVVNSNIIKAYHNVLEYTVDRHQYGNVVGVNDTVVTSCRLLAVVYNGVILFGKNILFKADRLYIPLYSIDGRCDYVYDTKLDTMIDEITTSRRYNFVDGGSDIVYGVPDVRGQTVFVTDDVTLKTHKGHFQLNTTACNLLIDTKGQIWEAESGINTVRWE